MTHAASVVLVSYGEVGTKSSEVRLKMETRLRESLAATLDAHGIEGEVERQWSRLFVHTSSPIEAARVTARTPGVVWARPSTSCPAKLDTICDTLAALSSDHGEDQFAVRARRTGTHDFTSRDVEREGGSAVQQATGAPVDLDAPDRTYRVEVRGETAYVSAEAFAGPGGLPAGTQGTVVSLVSGGIDSPVATWELLRRGCSVRPVYVDLGAYGGADHRARAIETVRHLARRVPSEDLRPVVVSAGDLVASLVEAVSDTRMLSLRRVMLRIGATVAEREDAHSVATGESIGQKSSQTGPNFAVTDTAVSCPVHRPLLTWDKTDIVAAARELGTYDDSTLPVGCERVAPSHPETNASLEAVVAAEPDDLLDRAEAVAASYRLVHWDDNTFYPTTSTK